MRFILTQLQCSTVILTKLHCCKGDQLSYYGERQNSGCQNSETPEQIVIKIVTGDYVSDITRDTPKRLIFCEPKILLSSRDKTAEPIFMLFDK